MESYESAILEMQESEADDCADCPYKGNKCRSQCMSPGGITNPNLGGYDYVRNQK